ncbi:MAG: sugar phosphate isomerase/epimerase, partial [Planctomycetes bacterium]|nr:sugar phosphate isomerase/epimerase [Planctomycetota bacterium]
IPGKSLKEKAERLLEWGGCGIEFGGMDAGRAKQIKQELAGSGCGVAALCWGYFPLIDPEEAKRQKAVEDMKHAVEVAAEAGSTGVIFVPAFNNHPQLEFYEAKKVILGLLREVGEHAVKVGNRVLLEPLNRGEARFLNQLALGAQLCRDSGSDGICMMGDFYHMGIEETSDQGAFLSAGKYLHHVHLASRRRVLPGQDRVKEPNKPERSFVDGFRGLKRIGFQDYCSLECGVDGDRMVEIPKSFALLKKEWEEATV